MFDENQLLINSEVKKISDSAEKIKLIVNKDLRESLLNLKTLWNGNAADSFSLLGEENLSSIDSLCKRTIELCDIMKKDI